MKPTQKKKSHRVERMNDLFREAIARFLVSGGLKHAPEDIGFVTITRVKASGDLQLARVYFTTIAIGGEGVAPSFKPSPRELSAEKLTDKLTHKESDKEKDQALRALRGAAKEIRHHLAQELNLRHTPELEFFYDDELEKTYNLERIFYDIEQKKKAEAKAASGESEGAPSAQGDDAKSTTDDR